MPVCMRLLSLFLLQHVVFGDALRKVMCIHRPQAAKLAYNDWNAAVESLMLGELRLATGCARVQACAHAPGHTCAACAERQRQAA